MGVEKMSVSFDLELGEAIRGAARRSEQSVSGWLGEAARDRLRLEALGETVSSWERRFGPLTDAEIARAESLLDKKSKKRSGAR